jgi:hypothetical protein
VPLGGLVALPLVLLARAADAADVEILLVLQRLALDVLVAGDLVVLEEVDLANVGSDLLTRCDRESDRSRPLDGLVRA